MMKLHNEEGEREKAKPTEETRWDAQSNVGIKFVWWLDVSGTMFDTQLCLAYISQRKKICKSNICKKKAEKEASEVI